MSHFVKVQTELREREHLLLALKDLGLTCEEGDGIAVRGDAGRDERAEIVVKASPRADVGFRRNETTGAYEIVADWYRIEQSSPIRREAFLSNLNRRYAYRIVRDQAREQNLVIEEERLENGDIVITLAERG